MLSLVQKQNAVILAVLHPWFWLF